MSKVITAGIPINKAIVTLSIRMPNPKRVIQSDRDGILDSCQIESIKRQSERLANEMIVKRINGFRGA